MRSDETKPGQPQPDASSREPHPDPASSKAMWRIAGRFSYLGIFFGVAVAMGWGFGRWLERRWGGAPWPSMVGALFGIASGFRELYRIARQAQRIEARHD